MIGDVIDSLDPRISLAARIGWVFAGLSVALSVLAGFTVGHYSKVTIERVIGSLYASRAQHIASSIEALIEADTETLRVAAKALAASSDVHRQREIVDSARQRLNDAVWIGVVDGTGVITADDKGSMAGLSIANQKWFQSTSQGVGLIGPVLFPELGKLLLAEPSQTPHRFIAISAPVTNGNGANRGSVFAFFDVGWVDEIRQSADKPLAGMRPVEVVVLGPDGESLNQSSTGTGSTPSEISESIEAKINRVQNGRDFGSLVSDHYLVGFAKIRGSAATGGTRWTAVVREAKQTAYLPANQAGAAIALSCLALGIGLSLVGAISTKFILRGLGQIAASADALRSGQTVEITVIEGRNEIARLSRSIGMLVRSLATSNEKLAALNRDLERKVNERTREIRRLSGEAKSVAITRERLRMSRDLHDTLAHSMLALLAQIRFMQKLIKSKPERIQEELEYAEAAAQEGLNEARQAVTKLRYHAVFDDGFEAALGKLVRHIQDRKEMKVALDIEEAGSALVGSKAEMVYRIIEEAMHNIERHADANQVNIQIKLDRSNPANHVMGVIVEDDGRGFDLDAEVPGRFGLIGMQEQAVLLGGRLSVQSLQGKGTRVHLEFLM